MCNCGTIGIPVHPLVRMTKAATPAPERPPAPQPQPDIPAVRRGAG